MMEVNGYFATVMIQLICFDDDAWLDLLPLTFTRPSAELRCGILTVREKWEKRLHAKASWLTQGFLKKKYPTLNCKDPLFINGRVMPDQALADKVASLEIGQALFSEGLLIAYRSASSNEFFDAARFEIIEWKMEISVLAFPWNLFTLNASQLESDFELLTKGRESSVISSTNQIIGNHKIFLEPDSVVEASILNANAGPIYVASHAEIMEGCTVRGGLALCEHSSLKMGTKIYGATTIGPHSKVGGEVNNSVVLGYSNKAHDGFLGNSVIGEWCNLGADTNNSNLKNNYAEVKVWSYRRNTFIRTGLQFCGLIMGDHSKSGINTMFNTGTVVGVSANIFGSGFPRNIIPSFSWGGAQGFETFSLTKAFEVASRVWERRGLQLSDTDKEILEYLYESSASQRFWERHTNIEID